MSPRISLRVLSRQPDERLVALARQGHERAFEALVERYRRPLLRYCTHTMRLSETRADDVLQHAYLRAWLALVNKTEVRNLKPWLYSIVHNTALNTMRGPGELNIDLAEATTAGVASLDLELERRMRVREMLAELAALPQMQRQAMLLTAVDGRSHHEVASTLGITQGAVRGLLYRARMTLRGATAALTPQWLIGWVARVSGAAGSSSERVVELSGGAGALGAGGVLVKGAALALVAGAIATGAAVVHVGHRARHATRAGVATQGVGEGLSATPHTSTLLLAETAASRSSTERASTSPGPRAATGERGGIGARRAREDTRTGDGADARGGSENTSGSPRAELLGEIDTGSGSGASPSSGPASGSGGSGDLSSGTGGSGSSDGSSSGNSGGEISGESGSGSSDGGTAGNSGGGPGPSSVDGGGAPAASPDQSASGSPGT